MRVVVETFRSRVEAELAAAYLSEQGIAVLVSADDVGGAFPSLQSFVGTSLEVESQDLDR